MNPFQLGQNDKILPIVCELQQSDFFLFFWISQVLLAKRKLDGKYYAVKVLQKKIVLNRKEVKRNCLFSSHLTCFFLLITKSFLFTYWSLTSCSKNILWLNVMCFWKMWNIHFWLDYITHSKQQKSFTLSWILLMEERYVVVLFAL